MQPTLRQLEYVVTLASTGQFIETARLCGVSQPALSKQIREVEDLLGVTLFERTRPRVLVTPEGEAIVARAQDLLAKARELMDASSAVRRKRKGTLRLGVIPTIAPYGLPGLLAKLRRENPDVTYAIHERQTDLLLEELRSGVIDLALLARSFDDHSLSGVDFVREPFVLVAPKGHPLVAPATLRPRDLSGERLILMEDGHCLRDQAIEVCHVAGSPAAATVAAASISTVVRMVESGLGATLVPASALAIEVRRGQGIVARGFTKPSPGRTLTLQWRASSPNIAWFNEIAAALRAHYLELNEKLPRFLDCKARMTPLGS